MLKHLLFLLLDFFSISFEPLVKLGKESFEYLSRGTENLWILRKVMIIPGSNPLTGSEPKFKGIPHTYTRFGANRFSSFHIILLTNKPTNKPTRRQGWIHNLGGRGNFSFFCFWWIKTQKRGKMDIPNNKQVKNRSLGRRTGEEFMCLPAFSMEKKTWL